MLVAMGEQLGNADIEIRKEYFLFSPDNGCQQGWKSCCVISGSRSLKCSPSLVRYREQWPLSVFFSQPHHPDISAALLRTGIACVGLRCSPPHPFPADDDSSALLRIDMGVNVFTNDLI